MVDVLDYGLWRQNFGQTNCGNPADINQDCVVDIRDYGFWRGHFGQASPAAGAWAATSDMGFSRANFTATVLANGKVLVAGGAFNPAPGITNSAELFDNATGFFTVTGSMRDPREYHTATLLPNGQVLVT